MSVVLGSGEHRYRVVENWAKLPDGWSFKDVAAVAVDSKDQVYVFNRGEHPMIVFDRRGQFPALLGRGRVPAARTACTSTATTTSTAPTTATTPCAGAPPPARSSSPSACPASPRPS